MMRFGDEYRSNKRHCDPEKKDKDRKHYDTPPEQTTKKPNTSETNLIHNKQLDLGERVKMVQKRMDNRRRLHKAQAESLDYCLMRRINQLARFENWVQPNCADMDIEKIKMSLEKDIAGLQGEHQSEELAYWKDMDRLTETLETLLQEYKLAKRKTALLGTPEKPENGHDSSGADSRVLTAATISALYGIPIDYYFI